MLKPVSPVDVVHERSAEVVADCSWGGGRVVSMCVIIDQRQLVVKVGKVVKVLSDQSARCMRHDRAEGLHTQGNARVEQRPGQRCGDASSCESEHESQLLRCWLQA